MKETRGKAGEKVIITIRAKRTLVAVALGLFLISTVFGMANRVRRYFYGVRSGVTLEGIPIGGFLEHELEGLVMALAIEQGRFPQNANIDKATGKPILERYGLMVEVDGTIARVMHARRGEKVPLQRIVIDPDYKVSDIDNMTKVIGAFSCGIPGSENRYNNIILASKALNNTLVYPGQVISFNETVGPRTPEGGYLPAPIMSSEAHAMGTGGGGCQGGTTLYNAALNANLKIVERSPHGAPVSYVPPGMDATVDYPSLDLKFKNTLSYPVLIQGEAGGRVCSFRIMAPAGALPKESPGKGKQTVTN